ncbi:hypothetical protein A6C57_19690 [Fibrella sp. ES10-3-2-2]
MSGLVRLPNGVAQRYQWVRAYTPVNEPLTTAWFAGLNGILYPHSQSWADREFVSIHDLRTYLRHAGATERELWLSIENPCPPSALGINHYVTSERFLNDNIAAYPAYLFASNGTHSYVDREVVRAAPEQRLGVKN